MSVIIPCYNEEEIILDTYSRTKAVLSGMKLQDREILFIDDGSIDSTLDLLSTIAQQDSIVRILSFSRNFGHQAAVSAGLHHCRGKVALIMDADLQDPPELLPEIINTYLEQQAEVVYCVRTTRQGEGWFKKVTAKLFYRLINRLSETKFPLDTGDFRLVDRQVIEQFKKLPEKHKYLRGLISWIGFKQVPFYYEREERGKGSTKYPISKMIRFALTGLTYFSRKPLNISIGAGFLCILIGLFLTVYTFIAKFSDTIQTVPGWSSLLIAVIFFGGIQLFTIGIIGIYLGNVFEEIKGRPEYIISRVIN
ncbi:MAG: glycosyltransferase [Candidatus Cloacimonetes bacterium]|nr:glycosyltransferase [Candidatus Cloacimonadota bacterium]